MFKYEIGQVVCHRRYSYRGVIVARDGQCLAADEWYQGNQTQPDRDQPWYHMLVHKGRETYVAQENLEHDAGREIDHPHVHVIFGTFKNGRYYRSGLN